MYSCILTIKRGGIGLLFLRLWLWDREPAVYFDTMNPAKEQGGRLMADWQAIKTEYITTDTSYRKLSQKYDIGYQAICQ